MSSVFMSNISIRFERRAGCKKGVQMLTGLLHVMVTSQDNRASMLYTAYFTEKLSSTIEVLHSIPRQSFLPNGRSSVVPKHFFFCSVFASSFDIKCSCLNIHVCVVTSLIRYFNALFIA